ncbi:hypothetical protein DUNSADRAFT_17056 [Dunaliella salina]|uniref:Encoded protein n=1 Tax=Dunaliella salina TaxID=3046 RepID=A0ABQ7H0I1_DUNSA|nr:hypothetical protein DUNSADRAFT_17056 [Dunaliella salina]|eukprot:KAF5840359.1 hypothetical protein DUNSADRAFT_17056 [Dunaliella salina]
MHSIQPKTRLTAACCCASVLFALVGHEEAVRAGHISAPSHTHSIQPKTHLVAARCRTGPASHYHSLDTEATSMFRPPTPMGSASALQPLPPWHEDAEDPPPSQLPSPGLSPPYPHPRSHAFHAPHTRSMGQHAHFNLPHPHQQQHLRHHHYPHHHHHQRYSPQHQNQLHHQHNPSVFQAPLSPSWLGRPRRSTDTQLTQGPSQLPAASASQHGQVGRGCMEVRA